MVGAAVLMPGVGDVIDAAAGAAEVGEAGAAVVVTKDPRWHWLEAAWDASEDAAVRELAGFVREHRVTLADELAGHVRKVCAPTAPTAPTTDDAVIVEPESE